MRYEVYSIRFDGKFRPNISDSKISIHVMASDLGFSCKAGIVPVS